MVELLDYLFKILGDETGNDELKNKLRYIKSLIEANQTLNDVNLSFTEKEIKIFKELCIKILNESPNYGCKTKKVFESFVKENVHPMLIVRKVYLYMLTNNVTE